MFRHYFRPSKCFGTISAHQNVSALFLPIKMFWHYFRPSKCFGTISAHQNVSALFLPIKMFRHYFCPLKCFGTISAHQNVSAPFPPIKMFRHYFRPSKYFGPTIVQPTYGPGLLSRYSDSLRAECFGDRIPVWVRFSAHAQTAPEAQSASCIMGTGSIYRG